MITTRRKFLVWLGAALATPAIVPFGSLMRSRGVIVPRTKSFAERWTRIAAYESIDGDWRYSRDIQIAGCTFEHCQEGIVGVPEMRVVFRSTTENGFLIPDGVYLPVVGKIRFPAITIL